MIETVDFSKSEQYTLSIRLSTDGFSFSVFNPLSGGGLSVCDYPVDDTRSLTANLKQAFMEIAWLAHAYRRVNVLVADKRYTLLPLEFFEDEQTEMIFYHNHPKRENESVHYNILAKNNVVVLFGMDKSLHALLCEQYPNVRFYAQIGSLVDFFAIKSRLGNNRKLYTHLHGNVLDVYAYEHGRLLLANSFVCKESADRIYYLLYIWKQLGFEQERDELHLTGTLHDKEYLLGELRKYVRQVFVMNPAANLDLQAITSCE